jgi:nucleolar protein 58
LSDEIEAQLKEAAQISMGTEVSHEDIDNINDLACQVLDLQTYRTELSEYISQRMQAIAPNLTILLGDLLAARLIARVGSLLTLAKIPASSLQLLGAEKALFRALKTKHDTPKYGLIFHASLVGQSSAKNKGKITRALAAKASLSSRVDALSEKDQPISIAPQLREMVLARIRELESGETSKGAKIQAISTKYDPKKRDSASFKPIRVYDTRSDVTSDDMIIEPSVKGEEGEETNDQKKKEKVKIKKEESEEEKDEEKKKKKKKEKKKKQKEESEESKDSDKKQKKEEEKKKKKEEKEKKKEEKKKEKEKRKEEKEKRKEEREKKKETKKKKEEEETDGTRGKKRKLSESGDSEQKKKKKERLID